MLTEVSQNTPQASKLATPGSKQSVVSTPYSAGSEVSSNGSAAWASVEGESPPSRDLSAARAAVARGEAATIAEAEVRASIHCKIL